MLLSGEGEKNFAGASSLINFFHSHFTFFFIFMTFYGKRVCLVYEKFSAKLEEKKFFICFKN